MASSVDICNGALAKIGHSPVITSISPPDGSQESRFCAFIYPQALKAALEMYDWSFSRTRKAAVQVKNTSATWRYAYAVPALCLRINKIIRGEAATDALDVASEAVDYDAEYYPFQAGSPTLVERQNFVLESTQDGDVIIFTNVADAVILYTKNVTDTSKFPAMFIEGLEHLIASKLAGIIVKGKEGVAISQTNLQLSEHWFSKAANNDASQNQETTPHLPPWVI